MIDSKLLNQFLMFSTVGALGGGALAKLNNKNIFLGVGLGIIVGIVANYTIYKSKSIMSHNKMEKEYKLTKNMTSKQKNQYAVSQGGKAKVSL
jgi:hypothetical protein